MFFKSFRREYHIEKNIKELKEQISDLKESFDSLSKKLDTNCILDAVTVAKSTFSDLFETSRKNLSTLQMMINELKGVVSMSRAALDEGRKFTGLIELPRLLDAWTVQYQIFVDKMVDLQVNNLNLDSQIHSLMHLNNQFKILVSKKKKKNGKSRSKA